MSEVRLGVTLWAESSDWPTFVDAALRAERLGYEHVWTWDHLFAVYGGPPQPIFEAYTALAALAQATERVRLGLFVGAIPLRNPGLVAKSIATIDHISGGRAILSLGAAWNQPEYTAFGIEFGSSVGQRLDWLAEALPAIRTLFEGGEVTSPPGAHYAFDHLRIAPLPVQAHLPIMVGGDGEKKTLRIVASYADMWNAFGTPETLVHKDAVLRAHCADVGRDPAAIERTVGCKVTIRGTQAEADRAHVEILARSKTTPDREGGPHEVWVGTPERIAEIMIGYRRVGFETFINEMPAPYDVETMETLIGVVKPIVDAAPMEA